MKLCVDCNKAPPRTPRSKRCIPCRLVNTKKRNGVRAERAESRGLCNKCCRNQTSKGKLRCDQCLAMNTRHQTKRTPIKGRYLCSECGNPGHNAQSCERVSNGV